jgi:hypothetical protein
MFLPAVVILAIFVNTKRIVDLLCKAILPVARLVLAFVSLASFPSLSRHSPFILGPPQDPFGRVGYKISESIKGVLLFVFFGIG